MTHSPPKLKFVLLTAEALSALLENRLDEASEAIGLDLPVEFLADQWLWRLRLDQIQDDPTSAPWLARATVRLDDGAVIGRAGFHGPPDERGMVEVGYEVSPKFRRMGYGRATALALIEEAATHPEVTGVRASVSPGNVPSLAIVRGLGFAQVGEQIDEIDGLELVFELPIRDR